VSSFKEPVVVIFFFLSHFAHTTFFSLSYIHDTHTRPCRSGQVGRDEVENETYNVKDVRIDWQFGHYKIICGGTHDPKGIVEGAKVENRYFAPTIVHCSRDVPLVEHDGSLEGP